MGAWDRPFIQQVFICSELERYVKQPRSLSPPSPSEMSSIHGGPCRDRRFGIVSVGPCPNHHDFHCFLRNDEELLLSLPRYPDVFALHCATIQNSLMATFRLGMLLCDRGYYRLGLRGVVSRLLGVYQRVF